MDRVPIRIASADDPRVDVFRHMRGRRSRGGHIVVESALVVQRLLDCRVPIDAILATDEHAARLASAAPEAVQIWVAHADILAQIVGFPLHRGVAAYAPRPDCTHKPVLDDAKCIVVAERIADPANLGALARNCLAFGVDLLVADLHGADPFARQAVRASAGHLFGLPLWEYDPGEALSMLQAQSVYTTVAATVGSGAIPLHTWHPTAHTILLVGNEGSGLSPALIARADLQITVPMQRGVDSLNVAAASAVLLYHIASRS